MSSLPKRDPLAEQAFVQALAEDTNVDVGHLEQLVADALAAKRPQLAARLVGLLPDEPGASPELDKARQAAALFLVNPNTTDDWTESWERFRSQRLRLKDRARDGLGKPNKPRRRKPRKR